MTRAKSKRRAHGEDPIYWDESRKRYIGAVELGSSPAWTRIRKEVSGKTKVQVRDKLPELTAPRGVLEDEQDPDVRLPGAQYLQVRELRARQGVDKRPSQGRPALGEHVHGCFDLLGGCGSVRRRSAPTTTHPEVIMDTAKSDKKLVRRLFSNTATAGITARQPASGRGPHDRRARGRRRESRRARHLGVPARHPPPCGAPERSPVF
jgi:hypothetical protein